MNNENDIDRTVLRIFMNKDSKELRKELRELLRHTQEGEALFLLAGMNKNLERDIAGRIVAIAAAHLDPFEKEKIIDSLVGRSFSLKTANINSQYHKELSNICLEESSFLLKLAPENKHYLWIIHFIMLFFWKEVDLSEDIQIAKFQKEALSFLDIMFEEMDYDCREIIALTCTSIAVKVSQYNKVFREKSFLKLANRLRIEDKFKIPDAISLAKKTLKIFEELDKLERFRYVVAITNSALAALYMKSNIEICKENATVAFKNAIELWRNVSKEYYSAESLAETLYAFSLFRFEFGDGVQQDYNEIYNDCKEATALCKKWKFRMIVWRLLFRIKKKKILRALKLLLFCAVF